MWRKGIGEKSGVFGADGIVPSAVDAIALGSDVDSGGSGGKESQVDVTYRFFSKARMYLPTYL